jgi:hypothetical protein
MPAMTPDRVASAVELFAKEAIAWSDSQSGDRIKAMEYYDGIMKDTPSDANRSSVVSRDFRAATKKVLPAITRTIFGSDKVFEYIGVGEGDEDDASQATDYINLVVLPECQGEENIRDAIHDALRIRNGIIKWWWDKTTDVKVSKHSGLTPEELAYLAEDDSVQIMEQGQDESGLYTVKLKRTVTNGNVKIAAIPLEEFHISPDALSIEDAAFVAHNQQLKRYQLVAMGYDREKVRNLPAWAGRIDQDAEKMSREGEDNRIHKASDVIHDMQEIDFWECYVRLDEDDDGIAELRRIVFAGGWNPEHMLEDEEFDDTPFADIVIERRPHEWQGRSLFDDIYEIQRVKTVLTRATLDNIYWQNNLQPIVDETRVESLDAVYNPQFGKPIKVKGDVRQAIGYNTVPFIAQQSFEMLRYLDEALTDRTGIADNSGGMPPDALQNVTAKASALMEQQGISQVELMVRNVAVGLKRVAKGLLKLVIQHQDKPRMVRLKDQPVQFDPKSWDASMDCSVNVGLGAGTRERDMMAMQVVMALHEKLLVAFGPDDNPFVKPDHLYNALSKAIQAAGLKSVSPYLNRPSDEDIQMAKQKAAQKKSPEQQKAEAQMQIEQMKTQAQMQLEQGKSQVLMQIEQARLAADQQRMTVEAEKQAMTERAQMEADLIVKDKELQSNTILKQMEIESKERIEAERFQVEREKMAHQRELEIYKAEKQAEVARENATRQERMGFAKMANDSAMASEKGQK